MVLLTRLGQPGARHGRAGLKGMWLLLLMSLVAAPGGAPGSTVYEAVGLLFALAAMMDWLQESNL